MPAKACRMRMHAEGRAGVRQHQAEHGCCADPATAPAGRAESSAAGRAASSRPAAAAKSRGLPAKSQPRQRIARQSTRSSRLQSHREPAATSRLLQQVAAEGLGLQHAAVSWPSVGSAGSSCGGLAKMFSPGPLSEVDSSHRKGPTVSAAPGQQRRVAQRVSGHSACVLLVQLIVLLALEQPQVACSESASVISEQHHADAAAGQPHLELDEGGLVDEG